MLNLWTIDQIQTLEKAVTLIDYKSIFSYHGYQFGETDGGTWMVAKAIQKVSGGQLHYLELNVGALHFGSFIHAVVKLGEDTFIDGRGLHTTEQLLEQWSRFEITKNCYLAIQPLFFIPDHLERNEEVIETIVWTINKQLDFMASAKRRSSSTSD